MVEFSASYQEHLEHVRKEIRKDAERLEAGRRAVARAAKRDPVSEYTRKLAESFRKASVVAD